MRTSHDEIAQASEHFLSCRFDPDDLEAQLAKLRSLPSASRYFHGSASRLVCFCHGRKCFQ